LDYDTLKLYGLSYTTKEIIKISGVEFKFLQNRVAEFLSYRDLFYLLYRSDMDKAINSKLEDPKDDKLFDNFIQST